MVARQNGVFPIPSLIPKTQLLQEKRFVGTPLRSIAEGDAVETVVAIFINLEEAKAKAQ